MMNALQLKNICKRFPAATSHLYVHPNNILVYFIGGKKFAYFKTSDPERWRFSIRVTPDRFVGLTNVPGIKPARYFARFHWITIVSGYHKLAPDFLDKYTAYAIEQSKASGATNAQITIQKKDMAKFMEMYKNPFVNISLTFIEPLPVGIVFTLVTAGVLSRKKRAKPGEAV